MIPGDSQVNTNTIEGYLLAVQRVIRTELNTHNFHIMNFSEATVVI